MREQYVLHLPWVRNMSRVFNGGGGGKLWCDAHRIAAKHRQLAEQVVPTIASLKLL